MSEHITAAPSCTTYLLGRTVEVTDWDGNLTAGRLKGVSKDHLVLYEDSAGWTILPRRQLKFMICREPDDRNELALADEGDLELSTRLERLRYRKVQIRLKDCPELEGIVAEAGNDYVVLIGDHKVIYTAIASIVSVGYGNSANLPGSEESIGIKSQELPDLVTDPVTERGGSESAYSLTGAGEDPSEQSSNNDQQITGSSNYTPNYSPTYHSSNVTETIYDSHSNQTVYSTSNSVTGSCMDDGKHQRSEQAVHQPLPSGAIDRLPPAHTTGSFQKASPRRRGIHKSGSRKRKSLRNGKCARIKKQRTSSALKRRAIRSKKRMKGLRKILIRVLSKPNGRV